MAERPAARALLEPEPQITLTAETLADARRRAASAYGRSMELLRANLKPAQIRQLDSRGYFTVTGCDTGWIYSIYAEVRDLRVEVPEMGYYTLGLCYYVPNVPQPDNALAMKWAFEFAELKHLKRIGAMQLPHECWERVILIDKARIASQMKRLR
jgi:hypothetical protein